MSGMVDPSAGAVMPRQLGEASAAEAAGTRGRLPQQQQQPQQQRQRQQQRQFAQPQWQRQSTQEQQRVLDEQRRQRDEHQRQKLEMVRSAAEVVKSLLNGNWPIGVDQASLEKGTDELKTALEQAMPASQARPGQATPSNFGNEHRPGAMKASEVFRPGQAKPGTS